jgi:hypothetical protein
LHIAIRVSDFEAAPSWLQNQGIALTQVSIQPEEKSAYLDLTDPEGNLVTCSGIEVRIDILHTR